MGGRSAPKLALAAAAAAAAVVLLRASGLAEQLSPERVRAFVDSFGPAAPVVFTGLYAARGVVLVVPAAVLSLAGGLAFGPALGTLYTVVGATAGAILSYLLARRLGRGFVERVLARRGGCVRTFDEQAACRGFSVVLFARLVPLVPFDAVSFGAGLSGIGLRDFALGTLVGIVPGSFAYNVLGDSITRPGSPRLLLALGLFALVASVPLLARLVTKRVTAAQKVKSEPTRREPLA